MEDNRELYNVNEDILCLMQNIKSIGWLSLKEQSIQRIMYLAKVLYLFVNKGKSNAFEYYHFSPVDYGPYSRIIENSIIDLKSNEYIIESENGDLILNRNPLVEYNKIKSDWIKELIYVLGLYGENRIFGFTINDPLYNEAIITKSQRELETSSENKTIQILNEFKKAFEETLEDVSSISSKEYLDLYFEYIFSVIIKGA